MGVVNVVARIQLILSVDFVFFFFVRQGNVDATFLESNLMLSIVGVTKWYRDPLPGIKNVCCLRCQNKQH
jgi:hypothetical protein